MIAGGIRNSGSFTDSVVEYDIDANTYNTIQSLPNPVRRSTLVNSNDTCTILEAVVTVIVTQNQFLE